MRNTDSDPDYSLPSSYSLPKQFCYEQNPRKKRSKTVKVEPLMASTSVLDVNGGDLSCTTEVSKPKKYYSKKPDPCAPKITMPCSECGKRFWSWKALFGHMRCHPERQWRGINPPPDLRKPVSPIQEFTAEDQQVASCLILLANNGGSVSEDSRCGGGRRASPKNVKACFGRSIDEVFGHKCTICMRVFSSGQALGGHKRCHWERGEEASSSPLTSNQGLKAFRSLDLNLPASVEDDHQSSASYSSAFTSPSSLGLDLKLGL